MYLISITKIDRWGREKRLDKLVEALRHENDEIRKAAALSLGKVGNSRVLESLDFALKHEEDYFVKQDISKAIASISSRIHQEIPDYTQQDNPVIPVYSHIKVGS